MALAVLCHAAGGAGGDALAAVPTDDAPWVAVRDAMRAHPDASGVQLAAAALLAAIACQRPPALAAVAPRFSLELLEALGSAPELSAPALTVRLGPTLPYHQWCSGGPSAPKCMIRQPDCHRCFRCGCMFVY